MLEDLETVIAIPPLPFRGGVFDGEAHCKNVRFLVKQNFLEPQRRRAIGIAGTSLIHHMDPSTLVEVTNLTSATAGTEAVIIAGLIATPLSAARRHLELCMKLVRPPDYFLLMPIPGVCNPEGIAKEFSVLIRDAGQQLGARFLLYMRSSDLASSYARVITSSPHAAGVKIGTKTEDVTIMRSLLPSEKKVLWGVGDRATNAARLGATGHTSGITLLCPRVCDEIFNAYRRGDFGVAALLEEEISEIEEIRFMDARAYNYSAVVEAARIAGFNDVDLGDGGPFNALPPPPVLSRLASCVERLRRYH